MSDYTDLVIADGATAFWPLTDAAAPYTSATGGPSLATSTGTNTPQGGTVAGHAVVSIAGSLSVAAAPPTPINGGVDFTVEAWIRPAAAQSATPVYIGNGAANGVGIYIGAPGGGTGLLIQGLMGGVALVPSATTAVAGDAYHVAVVFRAGIGAQVYVNGVTGSVVGAGPNAPSALTEVTFTGDVGLIATYPTALSGATLTNHYTVGTTVVAPTIEAGHLEMHGGTATPPSTPVDLEAGHLAVTGGVITFGAGEDRTIAAGAALRGPVAYGPRLTYPGRYIPPIVAKVFRLRNPYTPVVVLDQSFDRTWQEQLGEAGSGSVTMMNDDPDLALVRDGDVIRFELHGDAAFSFVVTDREKVTIASDEEHGEATVLKGPGLLAWMTSTMVMYPARYPVNQPDGPAPQRELQRSPIEEDRVFSWASYTNLIDNDWYGPVHDLGPQDVIPSDWPPGVAAMRIWSSPDALTDAPAGTLYFRMGFETTVPDVEIYVHTPLMDPVMVWLDGTLQSQSEGGPDYGEVNYAGGSLTDIGANDHVLSVKVDHVGGPAFLAVVGLGLDEDGAFTPYPVMGTSLEWDVVAYPPTPPPVTIGNVLTHVTGELNSRRYNPQFTLMFDADFDSDGNPWPPLPEITTKVGTDIFTFLQELTDHVEVWMGHDPRELWAWVAGHRGSERNVNLHAVTDPTDPWSGNLRGLTHRRLT